MQNVKDISTNDECGKLNVIVSIYILFSFAIFAFKYTHAGNAPNIFGRFVFFPSTK